MDKGSTGQTVMTALSELLFETDEYIPFGRLEDMVKKKLEYLTDGRTRSVKKAIESLMGSDLVQVSKNGFGESAYFLKFSNYHDLWKILLFIYDNAPPFRYEGDTDIFRYGGNLLDMTKEQGTYWFDIIVSLMGNNLLNEARIRISTERGKNPMRTISYPEMLRDRHNKKELMEGAFVSLVVGGALERKQDDEEGIQVREPMRFWNIRFAISVCIDYWLRLIEGKEKPYYWYTYFTRKSYSIAEWDLDDWPDDKYIEDHLVDSELKNFT